MTKYIVHCYLVVRVPVEIEADSHVQAIEFADASIDHSSFRQAEADYAEEIMGFMVDEVGDDEHINSRSYDAHGNVEKPGNEYSRPRT